MKKRDSFCLAFVLVISIFCSQGLAQGPETGPDNGSLVIVGGAMKDPAIIERFLELAGGKDAPIIMIPTAGGRQEYGPYWSGLIQFKEVGATNLTVLHTTDRTVADSEEFVKPIQKARGVFFGGGRQWHLADAYLHTRTHDELFKLLERGGVIGGTSAGATIQGSYLVRGDTKSNTVMMGDHVEGMGFLRNVGIDQHLLKRNRHFDMIDVIEKNPELLGIGLDENTAIVVRRDQFEVIGQSYVVIYDNTSVIPPDGQFFFLAPGDRYNMKTRKATRPSQTTRPIERVKKEEWKKEGKL